MRGLTGLTGHGAEDKTFGQSWVEHGGPGPRSMDALRWLDRLDVAGVEPLGLALGFGWRVTYSHLERLAAAGPAERVYDRDGTVAVITRHGRRRVGSDRGEVRRSFVVG